MISNQSSSAESIRGKSGPLKKEEPSTPSATEAFRRLESAIWKVHDEVLSIGTHIRNEENTECQSVYSIVGKPKQIRSTGFKEV